MVARTKCLEIHEDHIVVEQDGERKSINADTVVIASGYRPVNKLYDQLKDKVAELFVIGDGKEPRKCIEAIYEGAKTGREI